MDKNSNTGPLKPAAREEYAVPVSYKIPIVLPIINPITLYELQQVVVIL